MRTNENDIPTGFESGPVDSNDSFSAQKDQPKSNMHFGRRGPGRMAGQVVEKPKDGGKTFLRLMKYFKQELTLLILLLIAVIFITITSLAAPSMQGKAIDIIIKQQWSTFLYILVALLIVYLLNVLFTLMRTLLSANLSQRIIKTMRHDLFLKIDCLSIKYLDTHSNGDVMSRMTNDVENISNTISQGLSSLISGALTVVGTISIMFYYCKELTAISMITVVLTVFITKKLSKTMRKVYKKRSVALGKLNGEAEEMITGFKTLASYNKQQDIIKEFSEMSDNLTDVGIKAEILGGSMGPIMNCISNFGFVIVAAFGGYFALKGFISVGMISAFIIYAKQFSRPINEIAQLYGSLQTALAGAERVFEMMDQPDEDNSGEKVLDNIRGEIEFKNVNFSYLPNKQVLFDFNLSVAPGEKVALVGATGSGKTTVVNLLMRFYPTDSGNILIDNISINELSRDYLRKNTAIVLQDTVMFSDTIENNIKYSNIEATDEEMINAAEMSNSSFFINHLPKKYKTLLRQSGSGLSEGQRQLLAIARAILADPKILILDEATSSVDTRTEKHIQDAMTALMKNRTSLIIAHRLSTIRDADKIVVMDKGRVVEIGSHDELLALHGKYYQLYMTQFNGCKI